MPFTALEANLPGAQDEEVSATTRSYGNRDLRANRPFVTPVKHMSVPV